MHIPKLNPHHLFLDSYVKQYPNAIFYAASGLAKKKEKIFILTKYKIFNVNKGFVPLYLS